MLQRDYIDSPRRLRTQPRAQPRAPVSSAVCFDSGNPVLSFVRQCNSCESVGRRFAAACAGAFASRLRARLRRALMAWAMLAAAHSAHAAHPLLTEDTGTQGTGNAELELGFSWTRYGADRLFAFQPQLSYGLLDTLDLIVQPAWLVNRTASAGTSRGFGDTLADIKWRFFERAPVSFAVRGGFSFPTSQGELGLPHGQVSPHALIVTTLDAAPFALDANVGYIRYPGGPGVRQNLYHASAAAVYTATERMLLVADVAFDSNPDSARSTAPGVLLVGTVFTLRHGLDIDIGYQTRLNHAAPAWQWLLGITYRWTP